MMKQLIDNDRGAAALLVAAGMILFLGMAAMAIDLGLAFNERRQDQSAADSGVMAGALSAVDGGAQVRDDALAFVRSNLDTIYTNAQWQALWEGCVDPAAERNAGGFTFVALPAPAGWTVSDASNWCISAEAARGLLRVRVPDQITTTTFGRVIDVDELRTHAIAHSRIFSIGEGGILPFGLPSTVGAGGHFCLSSSPSGHAFDPCTGGASGNFGTLSGPVFGNPDIPTRMTNQNCNAAPANQILARNIAHGYDHIVVTDPDADPNNEVRDVCRNPFVDTLNTDTGFPNQGAEEGLVGPVPNDGPYSYTPRLAQSPTTIQIIGRPVDNRPLWDYLNTTADYGGLAFPPSDDAPLLCDPATFDNSPSAFSGGDFDWDNSGDGVEEPNESWQHMDYCINAYISGGFSAVMFENTIADNDARFAYVPEFHEPNLGNGNSWLHIRRFRAVYLQTTLWQRGNNDVLHSPGENLGSSPLAPCYHLDRMNPMYVNCPLASGNWRMTQLTAVVIPDDALPIEITGQVPGPGGSINPFYVELVR